MAIIREINVKGNKLQRQAKVIGSIAAQSARVILEDEKSYALAGTVGLIQGLKYNGSIKRGMKAGVATMSVMVGANIIQNLVHNIDVIKNA
jgi:hypothetical protein